jgi:hypothetical protein
MIDHMFAGRRLALQAVRSIDSVIDGVEVIGYQRVVIT